MEESTGYEDVVNYIDASILTCPEDDIWDTVFDWIQASTQTVIDSVVRWVNNAVSWITTNVRQAVQVIISPISSWLTSIYSSVQSAISWVSNVYSIVVSMASSIYSTIYSGVTSAISTVQYWIQSGTSAVSSWVTSQVREVWGWITTSVSDLTRTISTWFTQQLVSVGNLLSSWGENITGWLAQLGADLAGVLPGVSGQLESWFEWLTAWITANVVSPVDAWWTDFLAKIMDFPSWVSGLFDAAWDWLHQDVPGHSPKWQWIWEDVGGWWQYWFGWYAGEVAKNPPRAAMRVFSEGLGFVGDMFGEILSVFWEAVNGYVKAMGPTNPDIAESNASALGSLGMTAITGLAGMTLASSWMKPLGGAGMGQIAAMIYDMTNYKVITGASITALTMAAIKTPMTYHFNEMFRPNIVDSRTFTELMARKAWVDPEPLRNPELTAAVQQLTGGNGYAYEAKWLGYMGYPEMYHGLFKEMANTPLRYFPLAGIARTGFFETEWFTEALHRSGYSKTAVDALMVMYEKMRDEALQGSMSGAAVTRFKEGFTTEEQFSGEMTLLGYSPQQFDKYLAAARIDYSTDYLRDLISAYRDAVRKGNITLDDYRTKLLGLGIVPERVETYVYKERARLKPKEDLSPLSPAQPVFETDAGKIEADTIRRSRRKNLLSRDQEIAQLVELGMEPELATAVANNDDVRLAEKGGD